MSALSFIPGVAQMEQLFTNQVNYEHQKQLMADQQKIDQQNMKFQNTLDKNMNRFIWGNQAQQQVSGMRAAGLSPAGASTSVGSGPIASNSAGTHNAPSVNTQPPSGNAGDLLNFIQSSDQHALNKAQVDNINADTKVKEGEAAWKSFENSTEYQRLIMKGMEASAIRDAYDACNSAASANRTNKLTDAEFYQIVANTDKILSDAELNDANKAKAYQETAKAEAEVKSILQGVNESRARVMLIKAEKAATEALTTKHKAETKTIDTMREPERRKTAQEVHNMENQDLQTQLNNQLINYTNRMYEYYTPEERAAMQRNREVAGFVGDCGKALTSGLPQFQFRIGGK